MTTKVVYFSIDDVEEQAEFRTDDSVDDIRGLFICLLFVCLSIRLVG